MRPDSSSHSRAGLLHKLDASDPTTSSNGRLKLEDSTIPGDGSGHGLATASEETDSELVLRQILESGKYSSENEVEGAVDEYIAGKPLAYITGLHTFGSLSLVIRQPLYIPRVETEQWVLLLAKHILASTSIDRPIRILDICSGSGCIPLLLAHQGQSRIHTVGLEVDDRAIEVARENITRNGLGTVSRIERFDLFSDDVSALRDRLGGFDVVVSNPPYVSSEDMKKVEGKWWEGKYALQGKLKQAMGDASGATPGPPPAVAEDDDGLSFYRRIHEIYSLFLDPSRPVKIPKLVLEVGAKQSPPVKAIFGDEGRLKVYRETVRRRDMGAPKLEEGNMLGTERSVWIYSG